MSHPAANLLNVGPAPRSTGVLIGSNGDRTDLQIAMYARIHRGAHEIGGSCIELESDGQRLVLDLGRPLTAGWDDVVSLPDVVGLTEPDPSFHGVVLSHGHLDHYGLASDLPAHVPVYLGEEASRVLEAAAFFSPVSRPPKLAGYLHHGQTLQLGPFAVTPYLADHSAFDAYSLPIEAGGRWLFYTGDIRGHGRKRRLFDELCAWPPEVDVLLMEGTSIRAAGDHPAPGPSEQYVEEQLVPTLTDTAGMVAVLASAQNIDRLVTTYRAAKRTGRTLVVDLYTATVAAATGRASIPQPGFDGFEVYVPYRQKLRVRDAEAFERVTEVAHIRRFPENLATMRGDVVFYGTSSTTSELVEDGCLHGGAVVWSIWDDYLDAPAGQKLQALLEEAEVPLLHHHSSGHAHVEDLARLVDAFSPARVVPIHSEAGDRFGEHFPRVEQHADGERWTV